MVYAVDVDPGAVEVLRYRIRKRKLANVKAVLSTLSDARLPAESLDRALLCATYHLVYHQETKTGIFASLRRALRPSGRLCIVDAKSGPKAVDQDTAIADICSMGFRLRSSDVPGSDYILVFDPVK
jgi:ubiquinone/menaquinone biosynthesis C-methylase UbiE